MNCRTVPNSTAPPCPLCAGGTFYLPAYNTSLTSFTFNTQQLIGQNQNVFNQNGGNVAFSSGVASNVKPVQKADNVNTVNVFNGGLLISAQSATREQLVKLMKLKNADPSDEPVWSRHAPCALLEFHCPTTPCSVRVHRE